MKTKLEKAGAPIYAALLQSDRRYIGVAAQAKLIRAALRDAFPSIKFSVRSSSYSGGASIRIGWTDGPTVSAVNEITSTYEGGGFDGMIDLAFSKSRWLAPDGTSSLAHSQGSSGSGGASPEQIGSPHHPNAIEVHFGGNYIFTDRSYSLERQQAALDHLRDRFGPVSELEPAPRYVTRTYSDHSYAELDRDPHVDGEWLSTRIHRELVNLDFTATQ